MDNPISSLITRLLTYHPDFFDHKQRGSTLNKMMSWQLRLNTILSGIQDCVFIFDVQKNIVAANPLAEQLFKLSANYMLGKKLEQIGKLTDNTQDITALIFPFFPRSEANQYFSKENIKVISIVAKQAKEYIVRVKSTQIWQDGVAVGWVVALEDMSAQKQLEEMKLGFVSIAAHELRTPLTSIKGYLSVFIGDYQSTLNDDQKDLLNHISNNTERLLALVENLLSVSRIERGAVGLALESLDWLNMAKQIVEDLHEQAAQKNITLSFKPLVSSLPAVKADKIRVGEVLSNLITNAIHYTNPGGKIEVTVGLQGNFVITHVSDNGQGIPKEAIPHLFTKFYRVDNGLTMNKNPQGNGLGLYISKSIVDMHQGKIWVESTVGKGSVFSFSLPL